VGHIARMKAKVVLTVLNRTLQIKSSKSRQEISIGIDVKYGGRVCSVFMRHQMGSNVGRL
jgi:hypothetical protein